MATHTIVMDNNIVAKRLYHEMLKAEAVEIARHIQDGTAPKLSLGEKISNTIVGIVGIGGIITVTVFFINALQGITDLV